MPRTDQMSLNNQKDRLRWAQRMKRAYDNSFFDHQVDGALSSARVVVPIVMELVRPTSVIDIGCGRGAWLKAFAENGVADLKGIDGDYVDCDKLMIRRE